MGILVSQMYRLLWSRASVIVRDFGVTVPQMECLAVLSAQPGISMWRLPLSFASRRRR